ncbi:uncharacterized protein JCM6883_006784 [Sporobolomyces salmoneus]|uniref:uncharacterized protein n=1 Tax=Sporobolomyces salmoneus TaxID=183962 RepID=UPI003174E7A4
MSAQSNHIDFPLLKIVSNARSTYGLRHQDYARYKSHCTAKVHQLRKSTGFSQTAGRSKKYQRKDLTAEKVTSDKHLQILLFDSERCWAQSQLLKSQLDDPSSPPSTKHHLAKRLNKASAHASHLVELSQDPILSSRLSASQLGQIQAYYYSLSGSLAFERGKHSQGLETLSIAYEILRELAEHANSATEEALYNESMDELEPMLRFCAYKSGKDTSKGVNVIAKEVAESKLAVTVKGWEEIKMRLEEEGGKEKREQVEVKWRGEIVPVRNVELVDVAVKVQRALQTLEKDESKVGEGSAGKKKAEGKKEVLGARRMGTYDKALLVLAEAEQVASQLVDDNKIALSKGQSARFEASSRPLLLFHSYIQYNLLSVRTKRDLLVISSAIRKLSARESKVLETESAYVARTETRNPQVAKDKIKRLRTKAYPGIVKVYDTVLLSLETMQEMEIVAQDDELATKVEARIEFVRAQRAIYVSRAYALASQFPSALSLNSRAKLYSRQSRTTALSLSPDLDFSPSHEHEDEEEEHDFIYDLLPLDQASYDEIDRKLERDYEQFGKDWFEATGGKVESGGDEVDELPVEDLSLSENKGKEKATKQPAFYDVAYNYVVAFDMDAIAKKAGLRKEEEEEETKEEKMEVEEKAKEKDQQQSTPSKRGWGFGFFGRG